MSRVRRRSRFVKNHYALEVCYQRADLLEMLTDVVGRVPSFSKFCDTEWRSYWYFPTEAKAEEAGWRLLGAGEHVAPSILQNLQFRNFVRKALKFDFQGEEVLMTVADTSVWPDFFPRGGNG